MTRKFFSQFVITAFCLLAPLTGFAEVVSTKILWQYIGKLPAVKIYEPAAGRPITVWETQSVKNLSLAPVGKEISDSTLRLIPGSTTTFVLVMQNTTNKTFHFFAAPHYVNPPEFSLGFKFKCLCINHIFKVGPKEVWYRVVELNLAKEFVGNHLDITHSIIEVDANRPPPNMTSNHDHE